LKRTTKAATLGRRLRFFYRHVERARLLLYLLDVSPFATAPPLEAFETLRRESPRWSP